MTSLWRKRNLCHMQKSIYIENNTWARGEIWNFSSKVFNSVSHEQAHISTLLTRRSRLNSRFKKRTRCHSLIALHKARDMSAADWLFQTHVKNYRNFSPVVIRLFSEVEIPIKYSSICTSDKKYYVSFHTIKIATVQMLFMAVAINTNKPRKGFKRWLCIKLMYHNL